MKAPRIFPGIVFVLLGMNVVIVGITVYFAVRDPAAAVEPDYYRKAVQWDDSRRRLEASDRLGWSASLDADPVSPARATLRLTDRRGHPVDGASVAAEVFHHARSGARTTLAARPAGDGRYEFELPSGRAGLWQFRVDAKRGGDEFLGTFDRILGGERPGAEPDR